MKINFSGIFYQVLSIQISHHAAEVNLYSVQYADPMSDAYVKLITLSEEHFHELVSFTSSLQSPQNS